MFGKLIKYELRTCLRVFWPIWSAIFMLALINGLCWNFANKLNNMLGFLLTVFPPVLIGVCAMAAVIFACIFLIARFDTALLGNAGYLMFTLPVSTKALVASKALCALIIEALSAAVATISGFVITLLMGKTTAVDFIKETSASIGEMFKGSPANAVSAVCTLLIFLVGLCALNMRVYSAIAIGHLAKRNRRLWAIGAYVGTDIALSMLAGLFILGLSAFHTLNIIDFPATSGEFSFLPVSLVMLGVLALLATVFYFITTSILEKHLNLE